MDHPGRCGGEAGAVGTVGGAGSRAPRQDSAPTQTQRPKRRWLRKTGDPADPSGCTRHHADTVTDPVGPLGLEPLRRDRLRAGRSAGGGRRGGPAGRSQAERPGAVSSVDELLELLYPQYALVQRCLRGRGQGTSSRLRPDEVTWEDPHEAALHWDDGAIQVIMAEMERTACRPREVCLEVSREYPESPRHVYVPRCVSVHRCGGCCNHEALHCSNSSHRLVNKTLVELSPSHMERSVVMVTFVNHTSCECRPKRPLHSVIRREADAHRRACSAPGVLCSAGLVWDPTECLCVHRNASSFSEPELDPLGDPLRALCGPNKVLDPEHCGCACRNGLTESGCGPGRRLDNGTCACVCGGPPGSCPRPALGPGGACARASPTAPAASPPARDLRVPVQGEPANLPAAGQEVQPTHLQLLQATLSDSTQEVSVRLLFQPFCLQLHTRPHEDRRAELRGAERTLDTPPQGSHWSKGLFL
ncbi:hypothetical protein ANANG_G00072680 [Anguilla anguilla]|uniref:Platelet-derived growth factor (PDGF) family profile domain-containing protein n=1 Tax=Anguilla anguilla TaxID=7936 RepID=A0A9D3S3F5_ANGAN|nr:hypothetical protein ANANG_G00072680 [Anguilla anguilla]